MNFWTVVLFVLAAVSLLVSALIAMYFLTLNVLVKLIAGIVNFFSPPHPSRGGSNGRKA